MDLAPLFTPVELGAIKLANRIVMAPLTRSRANAQGVPAAFAPAYYAQRATAGMVITEATQVSFEGMGYSRTPGAHTPEQMSAWKAVADAVHKAGGKIVMQLFHVGRIANALNRGTPAVTVSASAIRAPGQMWTDQKQMQEHDMPRALSTNEIARVAEDFATAAGHAIQAGFDGVECHAANGYLIHQFLSSNVNQRTDKYGGSVENRVRMPLEVLEAMVAKVGRERVGVRVSPGHTFNGIEENDIAALYSHYLGRMNDMGLAYLHVMRPFMNDAIVDPVSMARGVYKGALVACGGYTGETAAALVASGGAQAVAFGKLYISNPDLVARIKAGKPLTEPKAELFYTPGEVGYTDYPMAA